ncbi:3-hydroxyacyl-CoA dehydrogenase, naD binding domain-containing protein [Cardiosporidium cionae]|uniref:3-hydroxyacyl-CoA dehydrogenase, naD binding domain-containing protein n=1 Tax=Cardiosporidium cionae TaxID=476202 RepID=A0ABQ7J5J6_9APIC|nr:3-hydroxyacyl-CoA dehydrogenase, naD binding domain-containing protein [Cardiosporidium cionae]|eukprot:KAF8819257.1 3-hydroxyacyl-CoA dehydrogenase, naD binding domain-containing protein [Cardiosporidium cionae]
MLRSLHKIRRHPLSACSMIALGGSGKLKALFLTKRLLSSSSCKSDGTVAANTTKVQSEDYRRIAVIGAGQMGTGIALTAAKHFMLKNAPVANPEDINVFLMDTNTSQLAKSRSFSDKWIARQISTAKMTEAQGQATLSALKFIEMPVEFLSGNATVDARLHGILQSVEFCIEAVSESLPLKHKLFSFLDGITNQNAILASNTSSISITKIAAVTKRADRVIGMHFMNPVPVMPLVEIIRGLATTEETLQRTEYLALQMQKTTARSLDRPGFVSNRVLMPYINEAIYTLQENIATVEDLDNIMKLGTNVPMGPLTLADFIGLDTCLAIMRVLHAELGDSKYRPAPLLVQYVDAGWLGKKAGRGFYVYK